MTLYVIATPIGNLEDITLRALRVLKEVDVILSEDTRVTKKLLARYEIIKPLLSYHRHSRLKRVEEIIRFLKEGKTLALVADAGTPGVNDPGNLLISEINRVGGSKIIPVPGPNAAVAALSVCGFPADRFLFLGFPPHKRKRQKFFAEIAAEDQTAVFYESPHRILRTLKELEETIGRRPLMVARELTKRFETLYHGTAADILERLRAERTIRGEFVVVVGPKKSER